MKPACFNGWAVIITFNFLFFLKKKKILESTANRWWKSCKSINQWFSFRRENTTARPWRRNSPQPEDASGPQVSVDMSTFHSSAFGRGCLHHCRHDTRRWPRYGQHCRCRKSRCDVSLCFSNMTVQLLTLFFLTFPSASVQLKKTT